MSSNSEQNGCQPPLSQQTAPPSDSRMRNASSDQQNRICRDYVWGICGKGTQCKFRHEFDVESMKNILKFCHDYQNRTGCTRPDCTYLHTTREEENLFLTTGQIPRALAERHAAMFSAPMNVYVNEYVGQAPPPPPPPPPQPAAIQTVPPSCTPAAPPQVHQYAATQPPPPPAPLRPLLAPPPPPPPPPPPTTSSVPVQMTPPVFSAPAAAPAPFNSPPVYAVTQPPPPLPMFDASRPPPPLSTVTLRTKKSIAVKRPADSSEAGPSKARKLESSKVVERLCESCIQRELRIDLYRKEMQRLECEREYQSYIYETKSEGYENGRLLLKSVLSPESFRILDEYIEGSSQQFNQMSAFSTTSTVPRQFLLQLMDCVFNNSRSLLDSPPVPSVGVDELTLLQSLSALTRRSEPINDAPTDVIQAVLGVLRNSTTLTNYRKPATESRATDSLSCDNSRASTSATMISSSAVNGLTHFLNGQKAESSPAATAAGAGVASRYPAAPAPSARPYPAPSAAQPPAAPPPAPAPLAPVAPSAPSAPPAPHLRPAAHPARPPVAYLPYQPPPARPYYPQAYPANFSHMPNVNVPYAHPRAGTTPQVPARPATAATQAPAAPQPPMAPNYNMYGAGRYPSQPHYYPPFQ